MSIGFRLILIIFSFLTMFYIVKKIRESKLEIEYSLFWIGFSMLIIFLSLFPKCVYWLTDILEIQSPVNFVYLAIIFLLILKNFAMTLQLSSLENKLKTLVQNIALDKIEKRMNDEENNCKR